MLNARSKQVRRDTVELARKNGGYHFGGSFSCVEILIALYDYIMNNDDVFILSKGHACWPLYVLLREKGLNPELGGHPARDPANGITCTTGSEGHGFPTGIGIALAKKLKKEPGRVFVLLGDGECQEGTTWESMLIAAKYGLDDLFILVDWNGCQGSGRTEDILPIIDLVKIAGLIGMEALEIDGHSYDEIKAAATFETPLPRFIIADTIKGKGVAFMEDKPEWHAKWPNETELAQMMRELS